MKWQYFTQWIDLNQNGSQSATILQELGAQGWELVATPSVIHPSVENFPAGGSRTAGYNLIFKRALQETPNAPSSEGDEALTTFENVYAVLIVAASTLETFEPPFTLSPRLLKIKEIIENGPSLKDSYPPSASKLGLAMSILEEAFDLLASDTDNFTLEENTMFTLLKPVVTKLGLRIKQ